MTQAPPKTIEYWNRNATTWDESMGEGSPFQKTLVEPKTHEFLDIQPGMKVLDIACGNGQMSRCLAALGAHATAIDGAQAMIDLARQRSQGFDIDYHIADLTQKSSLDLLVGTEFDAVLCNMALMDIEEINPVFQLAYCVLKGAGIFVFSITHPCFDKAVGPLLTEIRENEGSLLSEHSVKVQRYLTPYRMETRALPTLPSSHDFFHRPFEVYLNAAFGKGFVMCGMAEIGFPPTSDVTDHRGRYKLPEIPVVFIAKFKKI